MYSTLDIFYWEQLREEPYVSFWCIVVLNNVIQCYEAFARERMEVERAEKKKKQKENKDKFAELLTEAGLHGK